MIYGFVLVVHVFVCLVLIGVVLLQGGRGGLSEVMGGAAAQSLFGSSATTVLTRATTFCAGIFVITCLSLAYLSTARGRSVIEQAPVDLPSVLPGAPAGLPLPVPSASPAQGSRDHAASESSPTAAGSTQPSPSAASSSSTSQPAQSGETSNGHPSP